MYRHQFQPPPPQQQVMLRNYPTEQQHQHYYQQQNQHPHNVHVSYANHHQQRYHQQIPQKTFYEWQQGRLESYPNVYQAPYQSNSTSVSRYVTAAIPDHQKQSVTYPYPSVSSGVENNFQQTPRTHQTPSQPFSSSATYSVVSGLRANNQPSIQYNPSQYGFTSTSTVVKQRISHTDENYLSSQRPSKLSQIRTRFKKTENKHSEKEKNFNDAIDKAFEQQFSKFSDSRNQVRVFSQLSNLTRRAKDESSPTTVSQQQMYTQSTQTSILQTEPTITGSQYSQTDHYVQSVKMHHPQILQHSQIMPPVSVQVNVSSERVDSHLMPPPSHFHNTSLNSPRHSQPLDTTNVALHSSKIATPPQLVQSQFQTNFSQFSNHSTPPNPPIVLSSSFTCTPPTKQVQVADQQTHHDDAVHLNGGSGMISNEPNSQLSHPSLGPPTTQHNSQQHDEYRNPYQRDTTHLNIFDNRVIQQNTENPWNTSQPLISIPTQVLKSPSALMKTNTSFVPIPDYIETTIDKFPNSPLPPQICEPVRNEPIGLPAHEDIQFINKEEQKIDHNSIIADINSFRAVSEEGKEVMVVSDSNSLEEEVHEEPKQDDDSNNVESLNESEESEKAELSKVEFEKAIRNALRKARGFVHNVKENTTELLGWKITRNFFKYSERNNWKNRVTKTRPAIFRKRRYNLKSIPYTTSEDIIRVFEDKEQQPSSPTKGSISLTPRPKSITPKSAIPKKQTPDLNILNTPLVSPIPKNVHNHKFNTIPNESDIHEDFYLMKKLTSVKNFYSDGEDWNYDFITSSQPSSQPSEFSGLINEFM